MKTAKTGGPDTSARAEVEPSGVAQAAEKAASRPIQKHISNWERDLVADRSSQREGQNARTEVRHGITILSAVVGFGALLIGQPMLAIAIFGSGILISPGLSTLPRNDRDR